MSSSQFMYGLLLIALISGCSQAAGPRHQPPRQIAQANAPNAVAGPAVPMPARKIVYTSQIDVIVDDLSAARQKLMTLIRSVSEHGGYLAKQDVSGGSEHFLEATWTVRIPPSEFDQFVAAVEALGDVQRNTQNTQDVTEAYADLEARLRNKQSSEDRLLKHLEKSAELKDTLELERELTRVRGEVEQLQGQLNVLRDKAELATVTVTLYEREHVIPLSAPSFSAQIARTFHGSWNALVKTGQVIVLMAVAIGPWLVSIAVVWAPAWFVYRKLNRPRTSQ